MGDEVLAETKQLGASGDAWGWESDFPGSRLPGTVLAVWVALGAHADCCPRLPTDRYLLFIHSLLHSSRHRQVSSHSFPLPSVSLLRRRVLSCLPLSPLSRRRFMRRSINGLGACRKYDAMP